MFKTLQGVVNKYLFKDKTHKHREMLKDVTRAYIAEGVYNIPDFDDLGNDLIRTDALLSLGLIRMYTKDSLEIIPVDYFETTNEYIIYDMHGVKLFITETFDGDKLCFTDNHPTYTCTLYGLLSLWLGIDNSQAWQIAFTTGSIIRYDDDSSMDSESIIALEDDIDSREITTETIDVVSEHIREYINIDCTYPVFLQSLKDKLDAM